MEEKNLKKIVEEMIAMVEATTMEDVMTMEVMIMVVEATNEEIVNNCKLLLHIYCIHF